MKQKLTKNRDRKIFRKTAMRTRKENVPGKVLFRGGIRL